MTTTLEKKIMVIGGGIAGMTAALEAAEVGAQVILVEKAAFLGGRVVRNHRYFPKMCPPTCGFEINVRRIRQNPRITVHTLAEVISLFGEVGAFRARIRIDPRYVTGKVSVDPAVAVLLHSERDDDFNLGMNRTKALYLPHSRCYPPQLMLDRDALLETDVETLTAAAPEGAIDLTMQPQELDLEVGAVIIATGWKPYDATRLARLGFGRCRNVVTNAMIERLASSDGPTEGVVKRLSDNVVPDRVAFVQCAGSRDDDHLPYCSAVCCSAALKQIRYLLEQSQTVQITLFYIDIRTVGRLEKLYYDLLDNEQVTFVKGKVSEVTGISDGTLELTVEDTLSVLKQRPLFDMVVLSTGVVPEVVMFESDFSLLRDAYGFLDVSQPPGIFAAGCAKHPCDVSRSVKDATGAALKAIQCVRMGASQ